MRVSVKNSSLDLGADAFRWGALGKTGWRILRALDALKGATSAELVSTLKMNPKTRTLARALGRLRNAGVIQCIDGVWRAVDVDLKAVAQTLEIDGAGERQREQHAEQRIGYRTALEARRRRRERARYRRPRPDDDSSQSPEDT
jgi:hypothetical protein